MGRGEFQSYCLLHMRLTKQTLIFKKPTNFLAHEDLKWKNFNTCIFYIPLVAQTVKSLSAMQETWVQSLGREDPLKMGTTTHTRICAWRIPWTEETDGLWSIGLQRVRQDWTDLAHRPTPIQPVNFAFPLQWNLKIINFLMKISYSDNNYYW